MEIQYIGTFISLFLRRVLHPHAGELDGEPRLEEGRGGAVENGGVEAVIPFPLRLLGPGHQAEERRGAAAEGRGLGEKKKKCYESWEIQFRD